MFDSRWQWLALAALGSVTVAFGQPPDAFQISTASNLNITDSFVNVTNASSGNICVNTYVFDSQKVLQDCCSTLVAPNRLYYHSVRNDVISNTFTPAVPTSVDIKLLASTPLLNAFCN